MKNINYIAAIYAAGLLLCGNATANHHNKHGNSHKVEQANFNFVKKDAVTVKRTSSFELNMTPEKALPLFTAPGEILWAPGWQPNILSGDGFEEGTTWLTKHGSNTTYWHVSTYDKKNNEALYTMVTPDSTMGTVGVVLKENGKGGSLVYVTYKLTGLSKSGNQKLLKHYSKDNYPKMIAQWKDFIESNMDKINAHY